MQDTLSNLTRSAARFCSNEERHVDSPQKIRNACGPLKVVFAGNRQALCKGYSILDRLGSAIAGAGVESVSSITELYDSASVGSQLGLGIAPHDPEIHQKARRCCLDHMPKKVRKLLVRLQHLEGLFYWGMVVPGLLCKSVILETRKMLAIMVLNEYGVAGG